METNKEKQTNIIDRMNDLKEAKVYLSLIEGFGYGKTKDLSNKVDEFNKLLTKNFS